MRYGNNNHAYELEEGWVDLPDGESFLDIGSICISENDDVVVLNRGSHPVMVFDTTGDRLSTWGEGSFSDRPHGMGLGPEGDIYCTDDGNHTVRKFTPDGNPLLTLGTENEPSETGYRHVPDLFERIASISRGAEPFNRPTDATVLDSGEIFVADGYGNARIHRFSPEGDLIRSWGEPGPGPGEFRLPHSIQHDNDNRIWVADRENSRIQIFDTDGEFITEWTDLIRPTDLAIDGDTVIVSELCKRLSVFTLDGELLTRWGNEQHPEDDPLFVAPHSVAVDSNGDLYVGEVSYTFENIDRGARTIQKFERIN
jgi:DNA-binding beta-propeller fold protein YncE